MAISLQAKLSFMKKNEVPKPEDSRSKYSGQSIRAIPMLILTVGRKRSQGMELLVAEYKEKIKYYNEIEVIHIKSNPKHTSDVSAQVEAEDITIMQHLRPDYLVVVLDELGKKIGSHQLADLVGDAGGTGSSKIAFCIGGPYGLGPLVRSRADITIRLSLLVLNHQIALLVLLEQLYRSWTIIRGQKYHH